MESLRVSREDALKHLAETEREQRRWVSRHGHADIDDATHYHMVINTALVKAETIVQFARDMITPAAGVPQGLHSA